MDASEIKKKRQDIVERFGPWTAHCVHLGNDIYTFEKPHWDTRLKRYMQIASDIVGAPLETLRVLDLACLEGHFGIEFALHGSAVVAIEGRETNLAKARFVKELLSINNLELVLDDVMNLDEKRYGRFDIVLCLGILYHLNTPDVMEFMKKIYETCDRVTIIDTHISLSDKDSYTWNGVTYWGCYAQEHNADATPEQRMSSLWASLENPRSFLFTLPSLCNLLRQVGFTSVYECLNPYEYHNPNRPMDAESNRYVVWKNRITLVAIKGQSQSVISSPVTEALPEIDRPEKQDYVGTPTPTLSGVRSRVGKLLPRPMKDVLKKIMRPFLA